MRVGMIGIGDIAQKGYLPVITSYDDIELIIYTRNEEVLEAVAKTYKIEERYTTVDQLIESKIEAALVHSLTDSHADICYQFLDANIHVFVDKPIAYDAPTARQLIQKAKEKELIFMCGFNRRFAPPYDAIYKMQDMNLLLVEKHRAHHPDQIRRFIFDDFIHVIDTLLNFFPHEIKEMTVQGRVEDGKLYHVLLQLIAEGKNAVGMMNRDSGMNEEVVKAYSPNETTIVRNISEVTIYKDRQSFFQRRDDFQQTLHKRGVGAMTAHILNAIRKSAKHWKYEKESRRHDIAEFLVKKLEQL